jgi:hypothetical protein
MPGRPARSFAWILESVTTMTATPGLKIVTVSQTEQGPPVQTTEYLQHDRRRSQHQSVFGRRADPGAPMTYEYGSPIATIKRCDLGRVFDVNFDAREYVSMPLPDDRRSRLFTRASMRSAKGVTPRPDAPTVLVETTTHDTGERSHLFGHEARRVVTTRKETPLVADAIEEREVTTDGWYIDLDTALSCEASWRSGHFYAYGYLSAQGTATGAPARPPVPTFKDVGAPERGFPLRLRSTARSTSALPDGTRRTLSHSWTLTVTELTAGPLEPALFEVPASFRHAHRFDRVIASQVAHAWRDLKATLAGAATWFAPINRQ